MDLNFTDNFLVDKPISIEKRRTSYKGKLTKTKGLQMLEDAKKRLRELQDLLYADGSQSLLVVLQAMDAAGKDSLIELLNLAETGPGVRIFIGSENKLFSLSGSSLIVAPYRDSDEKIVGAVGVIGPTRLNYSRIVPMVDYTAQLMSRLSR